MSAGRGRRRSRHCGRPASSTTARFGRSPRTTIPSRRIRMAGRRPRPSRISSSPRSASSFPDPGRHHVVAFEGDPHRTLGLTPGASQAEIKAAYRRLARAFHPDTAGEAAVPRFLAIQAAYETLTGTPVPGPRRGMHREPWRAGPGPGRSPLGGWGGRCSPGGGPPPGRTGRRRPGDLRRRRHTHPRGRRDRRRGAPLRDGAVRASGPATFGARRPRPRARGPAPRQDVASRRVRADRLAAAGRPHRLDHRRGIRLQPVRGGLRRERRDRDLALPARAARDPACRSPARGNLVGRDAHRARSRRSRDAAAERLGRRTGARRVGRAGISGRHALCEWVLSWVGGRGGAESDEEGARWQAAISPRVEARLDEMLGHPETCPHGNPIDAETPRRRPAGIPLSTVDAGQRATIYPITQEAEEDARPLSYLQARAVQPGAPITVLARSESLDSLTLDGPIGRATLGLRPAALVRVLPGDADPALFHRVPGRANGSERRRPGGPR